MTIAVVSQFKQLQSSPRKKQNTKQNKKIFKASMGFEPVASVFTLQGSTSRAMKTHTLEAGQLIY